MSEYEFDHLGITRTEAQPRELQERESKAYMDRSIVPGRLLRLSERHGGEVLAVHRTGRAR